MHRSGSQHLRNGVSRPQQTSSSSQQPWPKQERSSGQGSQQASPQHPSPSPQPTAPPRHGRPPGQPDSQSPPWQLLHGSHVGQEQDAPSAAGEHWKVSSHSVHPEGSIVSQARVTSIVPFVQSPH
jgi:hypothetical protein